MKVKPQIQQPAEIQRSPYSPRSNTLFHFIKPEKCIKDAIEKDKNAMSKLKNILENHFFPRYVHEKNSVLSRSENDPIAFPMVCFCDIPIGRLKQHLEYYGNYGLGMRKDWGIAHKLNPVIYINSVSTLPKSFKTAFKGATYLKNNHGDAEYFESMCKIAAYIKPLSGEAKTIEGETKTKEFYQENEWRYVPNNKDIPYLSESEYKTDHEHFDKLAAENARLEFKPNHIRYIIVKNDFDASDLIDFIDHNINKILPDTPEREYWKKLLFTKIVILEEMLEDV